ncbi:MAG TPA: efflux transporter outer membrane subunit [Candidatus Omnitrophota bacterium]|nr:efflux transporter outer membrane subunit [Candidatus Omnitrophota bacterium]
MKQTTLFLILAVFVSGCAIGPRYREPKMELPQSYRSYKTVEQGEAMVNMPWWKVFNDQTLQELIRETLANNYDLRAAAARVDEARAQVGVTRSQIMPHTDLTSSVSRDRNSKDLYPWLEPLTSTYTGGFNTAWEVDLWGKIRQSIRASKAEFLATEDARRGVMVTLVADAAQTYFTILELDLELDIATKTLKTRSDNLDLFRKRFQGGTASGLEVARAEADYQQTAANIPEIERQIAIQENKLSALLGRNPGPIQRTATLDKQSFVPAMPGSGLPSEVLKRRPDIMGAEQMVRAANATVGVKVDEFLPLVNLNNFVGGAGERPSKVFDSDGYTWTIGGDVKMPLFQGGKNVYNYKAAKAQWQQSVAYYKQTVVTAFHEVADALVGIEKIKKVREEQEKQVEALKESAKLSLSRYDAGLSSYIEVLDADQQYYSAQTSLAKTQGSQLIYYVQLYRALGGGWQPEETKK